MKIINNDIKHNIMKIEPETEDDLWVLEKIISVDDLISGKTVRGIEIQRGDKKEKIKKTVFLKIKAESIDYNENQLRVKGQITEGPEEVSHGYHTFEIEIGKPVTIEKEWTKYLLDQLYDARKKQDPILICVLDDELASFALLTERIKFLSEIRGVTGKSLGESNKKNYYDEIRKYLEQLDNKKIILAGPGFTKENFINYLKEKNPGLIKNIFIDTTAHTGKPGIHEVLKRGIVEKINKESNLSKETLLVEKFFEKLAKDEEVTYGLEHVSKAVELGAVEIVLISDKLVKKNQELLKNTENNGGTVKIISSEHETGEKLFNMGGIAAILRYKLD